MAAESPVVREQAPGVQVRTQVVREQEVREQVVREQEVLLADRKLNAGGRGTVRNAAAQPAQPAQLSQAPE